MPPSDIPFNDLSRTDSGLMSEIRGAIDAVLTSGWYVMGPQHSQFELELAEYLGVQEVVAVANGTDALELALAAVGVGPGDLVMTVANAGGYTSAAARLLGATPVYCDISEGSLLATADSVEAALALLPTTPKAIVVTHLYGALVDVAPIVALARRHRIAVVEDCAQSLGARRAGRSGGTFGDIATTSFYPTKNLGALGDGGAVFTDSTGLADAVRHMRQYGWEHKYEVAHARGRNSRMDEMQAAILRVKLPRLDAWNERRRSIHAVYESAAVVNGRLVNSGSESFSAHLAVLVSEERDRLKQILLDRGVRTDVHFPIPDHKQPIGTPVAGQIELPVTEWASRSVLSLPLFPELSDDEAQRVREALEGAW